MKAAEHVLAERLRNKCQILAAQLGFRPSFVERPVAASVSIAQLVSPLRYDIIVRRDHFSFFRANRDQFHHDFETYAHRAMHTDYFLWFRKVVCGRFAQNLLQDESALRARFADRLKKAARLCESYEGAGFDPRSPITLRAGKTIVRSDSKKFVEREVYAGNGCHRIALLMLDGYQEIPPEWANVRLYETYQPLDNTFLLVSALNLDSESYYQFLSLSYAKESYSRQADLVHHLSSVAPRKLSELQAVVRIDRAARRNGTAIDQRAALDDPNWWGRYAGDRLHS